ncbi:MAG: hypothetical protein J6N72_11475, partial [Psychrobacter sp.]|nr:hypothetical protein [Psychrobacter sp.]
MSKDQQKALNIPAPEGFNFHDLNLARGEDGKPMWNYRLFGKILQDNGYRAEQLSTQEIEIIMGAWYSEHLANGGANEEYADHILFFFTEELLAGNENYTALEPVYKMNNHLLLTLPQGF